MGHSTSKEKRVPSKGSRDDRKGTDNSPSKTNSPVSPNKKKNADNANKEGVDISGFTVKRSGKYFEENYRRIKKLGDGAYGEVLEVEHKPTGARRAVKVISKTSKTAGEELVKEVNIVKGLGK